MDRQSSAAGVIGMFAHHETFTMLSANYGWTIDQCEKRLTAQLCELLLGAPTRPPSSDATGDLGRDGSA